MFSQQWAGSIVFHETTATTKQVAAILPKIPDRNSRKCPAGSLKRYKKHNQRGFGGNMQQLRQDLLA